MATTKGIRTGKHHSMQAVDLSDGQDRGPWVPATVIVDPETGIPYSTLPTTPPVGGATEAKQDVGNTSLAAAVVSLDIIDDWEESNRCKVNPITGANGIEGGAGAITTKTTRVTSASDDPAVVALQVIDDWDETDRCKVNVIVGQNGVASNAGNVNASTQRVTLANDDVLVAKTASLGSVAAATVTALASTAASQIAVAQNAARKGLILVNTDANAVLVKYGAIASASSFTVRIPQNGYWEMPQPIYTGRIDAIWEANGAGELISTEF